MIKEVDKRIFLIRHAKTEFNVSGDIMGGIIDLGILENDQEIQSLKNKISRLRDQYGIDSREVLIISSPLRRCLQTSVVVKELLEVNSEVVTDRNIIETDMGNFTGKNAKNLREEYGSLVDDWMYNPEDFKFPGGESYQEVRERVRKFIGKITSELEHYRFLIICSHVDIIKMMVCEVMGISFNTRRDFSVPNSSISILTLTPSGYFNVEGVNI